MSFSLEIVIKYQIRAQYLRLQLTISLTFYINHNTISFIATHSEKKKTIGKCKMMQLIPN